jgi:hypothetical protein
MDVTEQSLLPSLLEFFSVKENFELLQLFKNETDAGEVQSTSQDNIAVTLGYDGITPLSVGLLNWFNTNYSKEYAVAYTLVRGGRERRINVWTSYCAALHGHKKEHFDPFARGIKKGKGLVIRHGEHELNTTIRQMNYFMWAIRNGVCDYVIKHAAEIYADMIKRGRNNRALDGKKRKISVYARSRVTADQVTIAVEVKAPGT